ncbi:M48 family metallopeptidase [Melioribacter sp. OK-6-Me]|uniref:M48 family metallopeptidase n=1 Tax=unclassified Melioribacter TaxID=2627329 RepID=UPI003ED89190
MLSDKYEDRSKEYSRIKILLSISKTALSFIILIVFIATGWSTRLEQFVISLSSNAYIALILFVSIALIILSVILLPIDFYEEYLLEHKYNLSNQNIFGWIIDKLKGALVSGVIGLPLVLIFYWILQKFGDLWWLPFGVVTFLFSVLLARIAPFVLIPLFYQITPIENDLIKDRIKELIKNAGLQVESVMKFNMSKNTRKANAAFTGLGKAKRILLADTLLENYSPQQIITIIAHELGHYKKKHLIKNIFIGAVFSFTSFYLTAGFYAKAVEWFGFDNIYRLAALPLLLICMGLILIVFTPAMNFISRKYEHEADEFAVKITGGKEEFISTLISLSEQNLVDKEPHPLIEWFFYSHPSLKKRIGYIEKL